MSKRSKGSSRKKASPKPVSAPAEAIEEEVLQEIIEDASPDEDFNDEEAGFADLGKEPEPETPKETAKKSVDHGGAPTRVHRGHTEIQLTGKATKNAFDGNRHVGKGEVISVWCNPENLPSWLDTNDLTPET